MAVWGWIFAVGIGATLVMDAWAILLRRVYGIASLDYALVGRWLGHMTRRTFVHERIVAASPVAGESLLGWIAHYAIGIAFAGILLLVAGPEWARRPTPWLALAVGIVSIVAPFFIMQPSFGMGIAASNLPDPNVARLRALVTHTVFGAGLFLSAWLVARLSQG
ncbi:MAG: DUF2938 domain-containing protein [Sphingomonas sp.]|uniref:DUF2938 domain-containing protein n=1 Tax=Sphingomonas sp. TaxID=28214 RepID=UPI0026267200|nr:DUF2938 domain-containing protein [Sphingomonas sp.]MDK2766100.1 DUF2938 domain-containing protein [Sphingomonas sp.]